MNDRLYNALLIGGLIVTGVYVVKKAAPSVGTALNPTNPENVANQAFNSVYQAVTGSNQTFGADVYDATHFEPFQDQTQSIYQLPPMY